MEPSALVVGRKIYSYDSLGSTNTFAYHLAEKGEREGAVVAAEQQNEGRGKDGRKWLSPKGKGILFSVILRPRVSAEISTKITQLAAIAVGRAIHSVTGLRPSFKWPNDLLVNKKKVCGILCEMCTKSGKVQFVVVGIGINVNTKDKDLVKGATSLKHELKRSLRRPRLVKEVLKELDEGYRAFREKYEAKNIAGH